MTSQTEKPCFRRPQLTVNERRASHVLHAVPRRFRLSTFPGTPHDDIEQLECYNQLIPDPNSSCQHRSEPTADAPQ